MTTTETIDQKHLEDLERLRAFRLIDDDFFTKCFEGDTECVKLVLQIVLDKSDLNVVDVRTQVFVENLLNRSVRLDVLATDSTRFFKESKEGIATMSKIIEDMRLQSYKEGKAEGQEENKKETALRMLERI